MTQDICRGLTLVTIVLAIGCGSGGPGTGGPSGHLGTDGIGSSTEGPGNGSERPGGGSESPPWSSGSSSGAGAAQFCQAYCGVMASLYCSGMEVSQRECEDECLDGVDQMLGMIDGLGEGADMCLPQIADVFNRCQWDCYHGEPYVDEDTCIGELAAAETCLESGA